MQGLLFGDGEKSSNFLTMQCEELDNKALKKKPVRSGS